ncbi:hypothetical protein ACJ73_09935, partial [Blastomyces percursus]
MTYITPATTRIRYYPLKRISVDCINVIHDNLSVIEVVRRALASKPYIQFTREADYSAWYRPHPILAVVQDEDPHTQNLQLRLR